MPPALPPYFGAAYYPEHWPLEQIDRDIASMKSAGMNAMRIGEFAWSSMEPREDQYDFDWLHLVIGKLADAGIATILGTPSATPPIWLVERHPEVLAVTDEGKPQGHGARRHVCPNNRTYREYCAKIVTRMADEFGQDDRVIGWQIDNEVYHISWPARPCCCPQCVRLFQKRMREKFGTIEALNRAWRLTLWSQEYASFDQLPIPRRDIWHHPSLLAEWSHFGSDSLVEYVRWQADILHERTIHPIGTDMMPFTGVDYVDMHRKLDLVQFNHYHDVDSLWRAGFWFDFIRPLKSAPFWNTETQTSWNGSVAINAGIKPPGWCRVNSWLPIALGGEANLYWLWRQHASGQELMHGAVLASSGRPLHIFPEVQEIGRGLEASGEFLRDTKPTCSGLGLLFSHRVGRMYNWQPMVANFAYDVELQDRVYRPMLHAQLRPDILSSEADLTPYKLIVAPFLLTLDEAGLRARLRAWIEAGGTLVIGPMSDVRDSDLGKFADGPFGSLEDWGGVYCRHSIPGFPEAPSIAWADGTQSHGAIWADALEPREAEVLATYTSGPNEGCAAVTRRKLGAGAVIVLGTMPAGGDLVRLLVEAGAAPSVEASESVLAAPRNGEAGGGMVVLELENRAGWLDLDERKMVDLLTGAEHTGRLELAPYATLVLREV